MYKGLKILFNTLKNQSYTTLIRNRYRKYDTNSEEVLFLGKNRVPILTVLTKCKIYIKISFHVNFQRILTIMNIAIRLVLFMFSMYIAYSNNTIDILIFTFYILDLDQFMNDFDLESYTLSLRRPPPIPDGEAPYDRTSGHPLGPDMNLSPGGGGGGGPYHGAIAVISKEDDSSGESSAEIQYSGVGSPRSSALEPFEFVPGGFPIPKIITGDNPEGGITKIVNFGSSIEDSATQTTTFNDRKILHITPFYNSHKHGNPFWVENAYKYTWAEILGTDLCVIKAKGPNAKQYVFNNLDAFINFVVKNREVMTGLSGFEEQNRFIANPMNSRYEYTYANIVKIRRASLDYEARHVAELYNAYDGDSEDN
jgi:hypothetical protein